ESITPRRPARAEGFKGDLEAPIGIEPMIKVLQTSALPLGYGAPSLRPRRPLRGRSALDRRRGTTFELARSTREDTLLASPGQGALGPFYFRGGPCESAPAPYIPR